MHNVNFDQIDIRTGASVTSNGIHRDKTTVASATTKVPPCLCLEIKICFSSWWTFSNLVFDIVKHCLLQKPISYSYDHRLFKLSPRLLNGTLITACAFYSDFKRSAILQNCNTKKAYFTYFFVFGTSQGVPAIIA